MDPLVSEFIPSRTAVVGRPSPVSTLTLGSRHGHDPVVTTDTLSVNCRRCLDLYTHRVTVVLRTSERSAGLTGPTAARVVEVEIRGRRGNKQGTRDRGDTMSVVSRSTQHPLTMSRQHTLREPWSFTDTPVDKPTTGEPGVFTECRCELVCL